jgi:mannose-6-phosphate isomerase-like protein (cupin superfamily)
MASEYGLVLLESGSLVDTAAGEVVPAGARPMAPTSQSDAATLDRMTPEQAEAIVVRHHNANTAVVSAIIGEDAPLGWAHGFEIDRIELEAGGTIDWDGIDAKEVLFVNRGRIDIECDDGVITLTGGDTISLPLGPPRRLLSENGATMFLVRP